LGAKFAPETALETAPKTALETAPIIDSALGELVKLGKKLSLKIPPAQKLSIKRSVKRYDKCTENGDEYKIRCK